MEAKSHDSVLHVKVVESQTIVWVSDESNCEFGERATCLDIYCWSRPCCSNICCRADDVLDPQWYCCWFAVAINCLVGDSSFLTACVFSIEFDKNRNLEVSCYFSVASPICECTAVFACCVLGKFVTRREFRKDQIANL